VHNILIVDDDKATCDLLRACLSEGYEVIDTQDPEQALGLALEHKPDAILLDLMMPKFSGFELCQSFRSLSYTSVIPVLVITGETGAKYKDHCENLGAVAYFEKPLKLNELRRRLTVELQSKRSEQRAHVREGESECHSVMQWISERARVREMKCDCRKSAVVPCSQRCSGLLRLVSSKGTSSF